jgi:hypothetical protein
MRLDSGAKATFKAITLTGANHDAARKIFGQVYTMVQGDTHFIQEVERGEVLISSITLEIKGDADMHSRLCIQGSTSSIAWIISQLWPVSSATGV